MGFDFASGLKFKAEIVNRFSTFTSWALHIPLFLAPTSARDRKAARTPTAADQ
jgi:hypothetical protein